MFWEKSCARARTRYNNFPCCARESWKDALYSRLPFFKRYTYITHDARFTFFLSNFSGIFSFIILFYHVTQFDYYLSMFIALVGSFRAFFCDCCGHIIWPGKLMIIVSSSCAWKITLFRRGCLLLENKERSWSSCPRFQMDGDMLRGLYSSYRISHCAIVLQLVCAYSLLKFKIRYWTLNRNQGRFYPPKEKENP